MLTFQNDKLNQNYFGMKRRYKALLVIMGLMFSFIGCSTDGVEGLYDYELKYELAPSNGIFKLEKDNGSYEGVLNSFESGKIELENLKI